LLNYVIVGGKVLGLIRFIIIAISYGLLIIGVADKHTILLLCDFLRISYIYTYTFLRPVICYFPYTLLIKLCASSIINK